MRRIADAGASLRVTLYPAKGEDDEHDGDEEDGRDAEDLDVIDRKPRGGAG